jgi:ubiquinone/menaquinone biosynthesis C-methylase UbiE
MKDNKMSWEEAITWLRNNPEQQELVYHCYYDDPLDQAAERFSNSEEWTAVRNLLNYHIPGKVLDLGAGRGISSYAFAKSGCIVTALEPDPSSLVGAGAILTLSKVTHLPISIIQKYGETLPLDDNSFDIVYGRAVLHHAQDLSRLCKEAARILRPGGIFLATREHVISNKENLQIFLDNHPLHSLYGGENAYLLKEYQHAIIGAGLKLLKTLGPFESEINYFPMTKAEFLIKMNSFATNLLGSFLASILFRSSIVLKFCGWLLSLISNTPGRLYSFQAIKL